MPPPPPPPKPSSHHYAPRRSSAQTRRGRGLFFLHAFFGSLFCSGVRWGRGRRGRGGGGGGWPMTCLGKTGLPACFLFFLVLCRWSLLFSLVLSLLLLNTESGSQLRRCTGRVLPRGHSGIVAPAGLVTQSSECLNSVSLSGWVCLTVKCTAICCILYNTMCSLVRVVPCSPMHVLRQYSLYNIL